MYRVRSGCALILMLSMMLLLDSSSRAAESVPREAYDAANAFLQVLVRFAQKPAGERYAHYAMKLERPTDLAEATFAAPFPMYTMSSSDLQGVNLEPSSFLTHAKFCYYYFPLLIRGEYHGVITVDRFQDKWTGAGYIAQEPAFDYICRLMAAHRDSADCEYSSIQLDNSVRFAFVRISGKYYLMPANERSASLFGDNRREITFDEARPFLTKHVSMGKGEQ